MRACALVPCTFCRIQPYTVDGKQAMSAAETVLQMCCACDLYVPHLTCHGSAAKGQVCRSLLWLVC